MPGFDWAEIAIFLAFGFLGGALANACVDLPLVSLFTVRRIEKAAENGRLVRTSKAIAATVKADVLRDLPTKTDIESIKADLKAFGGMEARLRAKIPPDVHGELEALKTDIQAVAGMEARLTAQIPPNVHGELEEVKAWMNAFDAKMASFATDVFARVDGVPALVRNEMQLVQARQMEQLTAQTKAEAGDLAAKANALQVQGNPLQAQAVAFINRKPSKAVRDNPITEGIQLYFKNLMAKGLALETGQTQVLGYVTGESGGFAPGW